MGLMVGSLAQVYSKVMNALLTSLVDNYMYWKLIYHINQACH